MLRRIFALAGVVCLAHVATAQTCTNASDVFLKNDALPQIPNQQTVSVIPGLCEGESCGCVFDVSNQLIYSSDVKVNMCAVGFINVASANGITAAVNMRIFDGVTWNPAGTIPTFGPLVFDFENQTGSSIQISSSAINTVDIPSTFDVHVTSGQLVVVFDMEINTGGDCANGGREVMRTALCRGLPCIGVCLGMQLFFEVSEEGWGVGLGVIPGRVRRLSAKRTPQIGWNEIIDTTDTNLDLTI